MSPALRWILYQESPNITSATLEMRIAYIGYDAVELTGHLDKSSFHRVVGLPGDSVVKNPPANTGDKGLIPGSGIFPGEGNGNPLQCSCLGNPMDRGTWQVTVHVGRVAQELYNNLVTKQQQDP